MTTVPTPPKPDVPEKNATKTPAVKKDTGENHSEGFFSWFRKNRVLVIVLAVCLVVGIVGGLTSWHLHNKSQEPEEQLRSSTTYEMISTVLAQEAAQEPASLLVAPAEEKWWTYLTDTNMNTQVAGISFADISEKAVYFAYTISSGQDFTGHQMIGLPTTFVIYETTDDAVAVSHVLNNNGVNNFVRGNMLLLLPAAAHTDVHYSLDQFVRSEQVIDDEDIKLDGEALLMMNFSEFQEVYPQGWENQTFVENFKRVFAIAGVQPEGSGWVGTSADGATWQGRLFGFVPQSELLTDATALHTFLQGTQEYILPDGSVTTEQPAEFSGPVTRRQAAAGDYFNVATADAVSVGIYEFDSTAPMEVETLRERGSSDLLEVTVDVNQWLGYLEGFGSATRLLPVERAVFTLHDASGKSTLQFVDAPDSENSISSDFTEQPTPPTSTEDGEG